MFFFSTPGHLPRVGDAERASVGLQHWKEHVAKLEDSRVAKFARALPDDPLGGKLLAGLFSNSPFLSHCILRDVEFFVRLVQEGPERLFEDVLASLGEPETGTANRNTVMARLRTARTRTALLVAVADLTDHWTLEQVTGALTRFADTALSASLVHLLRQAEERGELELSESEQPEQRCGLVVLAMGKYGAGELNYSSDIDLIVLFDPARIDYRGRRSVQEAMVRLTRDLVSLLEERTGDGYVFRVDLRLRPDPGATPLAISLTAALTYYESMGQNWERAAMIKARPAAGDLEIGHAFLTELSPLRMAQEPRFLGHPRRPFHQAANQCPQGRHPHHAGRTERKAGPRRHSRGRVLRPDAAAHLRRPRTRAAHAAHDRGADGAGRGRPHQPWGRGKAVRRIPISTPAGAPPADGQRPADP